MFGSNRLLLKRSTGQQVPVLWRIPWCETAGLNGWNQCRYTEIRQDEPAAFII